MGPILQAASKIHRDSPLCGPWVVSWIMTLCLDNCPLTALPFTVSLVGHIHRAPQVVTES